MPHQNVSSSDATAQNAATDKAQPNDPGREQSDSARPEPRSYAAGDAGDSSLAPPAAGETADYMDEGQALGADDVQMGGDHRNRPHDTEVDRGQGAKTRNANRDIAKGRDAGG